MFIPNPVHLLEMLLLLIVLVIASLLAWKYRSRLLMAVTGDDRIHFSPLDFVWWFCCECCCLQCTCDWTRSLTRCPLCPKRIRGANLVKLLGRSVGLAHYSVELKNIVVGDLPWPDHRHGDFYLNITCEANPSQNTSLAQERLPKVVHFPEVVTLHLRNSHLEQSVQIRVNELSVVGHSELCSCQISSIDILKWAFAGTAKRFVMKPVESREDVDSPPWILVEFGQPSEARDLEHFHGNPSTVRTGMQDGTYRDATVGVFKNSYALLDPTGHAIYEPAEDDLDDIERVRCCVSFGIDCCNCCVWPLILAIGFSRAYVRSCYRHFKEITMAVRMEKSFPISNFDLARMVKGCALEFDGTGVGTGIVPCRPNATQIISVCDGDHPGGLFPQAQPTPLAFSEMASDMAGVPCKFSQYNMCPVMTGIADPVYDLVMVGGCALLALLPCCCRFHGNRVIRDYKSGLQHSRSMEMRQSMQSRR